MRYLADLLTFSRFVLGLFLLYMAFFGGAPEIALIVFLVAELTDAFDGTCARKWPFPKNKTPRYRKYAAKYDMASDVLLAGAQVLFLALQVNLIAGVAVMAYYAISAVGGDLLVYGKILGHPDDYHKKSLMDKNFPLAKKLILIRRHIFVACLVAVSILILFATNWPVVVKIGLLLAGSLILAFMWFFLRQRRENISRDAVDIEKKLAKKKRA